MTLDEKIITVLQDFIPDERNQLHVLAIIQEFINQERKKIYEELIDKPSNKPVINCVICGATKKHIHEGTSGIFTHEPNEEKKS